ncbi:MAG TPA: AbiV family abortive infection protein [Nitrososphaeraceae archaeon]|jgi:AbiV family abortive infection protein|nr:AbiV family abortive infection protein [Nitrososphaeraceae archaeon]
MGDYLLSDSQLMEGIDYCFNKASRLLNSVESLLNSQDKFWESSHALGLYTFAIEEFGKGLLLKDRYQQGSHNIQIPSWRFAKDFARGIKPHDEKIKRAFKELPDVSKQIMVGIVVDKPSPATKTIKFRDGEMSVNGMTTGLFMTDNHIDLDVRMKSFYVDWNKDRNEWEYELTTTKEYLENAVSCFKTELARQVKSIGLRANTDKH